MPGLDLGIPTTHQSLTVFPVLVAEPWSLPCQLLTDAIATGTLQVTEVDGGTVPELLVRNDAPRDVLIMDGEQLIGARQNRTTSRSLVIPAQSEVKIPVSCMEQGRWSHVSPTFAAADYHSPSKVRRHARRTECAEAEQGRAARPEILRQAQSLVWEEIASTASSLSAHSGTGALNEMYDQRAADLATWADAFPWQAGQVGILALLGGKPLGLDVIGDAGLYARIHPRLMMGYVMDALSDPSRSGAGETRVANDYLASVGSAVRTSAPTTGKGRYQVLSGAVVGAELEVEGRLVHLSAFPGAPPQGSRDGGPLRPPSRRRGPAA